MLDMELLVWLGTEEASLAFDLDTALSLVVVELAEAELMILLKEYRY